MVGFHVKGEVAMDIPSFSNLDKDSSNSDPFLDYPSMSDIYVPQDRGYLDASVDYLKKSRESISEAVTRLGRIMDRYFAGKEHYSHDNESYLSIRTSQQWLEGGKLEPVYDYKFRLDLPGTKRRYRLIVEYQDDDDTESLEQRSRPSQSALPSEEQSLLAGLVRNLANEGDKWQAKISGGIKVKLPPDPFIRLKAEREIKLGEFWDLDMRARAEWRNSNGIHNAFDMSFDRLLFDEYLFRARTSFDWRDEDDTLEMGQQFSVFQTLSAREVVEYQFGVFGNSLSDPHVNTYYFSVFYRSKVYKDWFFIDIIPEYAYERENNFSGVASITAAIEILFHNW